MKLIIYSIIWATLILLSAYFFKGTEFGTTLSIFLIGGWYIGFLSLQTNRESLQKEWNCIKTFWQQN